MCTLHLFLMHCMFKGASNLVNSPCSCRKFCMALFYCSSSSDVQIFSQSFILIGTTQSLIHSFLYFSAAGCFLLSVSLYSFSWKNLGSYTSTLMVQIPYISILLLPLLQHYSVLCLRLQFYSIPFLVETCTLTCIQYTFTPQSAKFQNHSNSDISIPKPC